MVPKVPSWLRSVCWVKCSMLVGQRVHMDVYLALRPWFLRSTCFVQSMKGIATSIFGRNWPLMSAFWKLCWVSREVLELIWWCRHLDLPEVSGKCVQISSFFSEIRIDKKIQVMSEDPHLQGVLEEAMLVEVYISVFSSVNQRKDILPTFTKGYVLWSFVG